ncbi:putative DNA-binding protein [Paradesulfitobacterium ferrireducens]|uniref:putative DNA-binding protein n=1 Tax=Paradesulfitobacterium ferrireducens TaxID=2816476 RepID=UPI001A90606A|nr:putative DNA-binding protein [Paradesulfitobacterium ferrireducens]
MEKIAQMALLADFYGPLLTGKQRNAWDMHFEQDLSLAEIAEVEKTSRQAVHDLLKRTERILLEYEEKLGLVQRFISEREKLLEISGLLAEINTDDFAKDSALKRHQLIRAKLEEILQEL